MAVITPKDFSIAVDAYLKNIERRLKLGIANEHAHRSDFQVLLETFDPDLTVINEPTRTEIGQPDFIVTEGLLPKGYIEAKDIGIDLDKVLKTDQFRRYLGLQNFILTDYLEFRWFVLEEERPPITRLASFDGKGRLVADEKGIADTYKLLVGFRGRPVPSVRSPKELASRMAALAKNIVNVLNLAMAREEDSGSLHRKLEGFRKILLPDMTEEQFSDMYAQTLVYGYFAARCNHKGNDSFSRFRAGSELPKTNPFLRKMFQNLSEDDDTLFEEGIDWVINDLVDLLAQAKMEEILLNFGKRSLQQDPVVHFYETFLSIYDPKLREKRGVFYTPEPVVSFIVRSVDYLLRKRFDLQDGLADTTMIPIKTGEGVQDVHKVLILDPATGTGTFLHGVIEHIYEKSFRDNAGMWPSYVPKHLLPRLFGFELLMAPYAVAHMKLGLQLQELGYDFQSSERLRVYLTNTLEEAGKNTDSLFATWLSDEANAASDVKLNKPVMVILGNPPYSAASENTSPSVEDDVRKFYYPKDEIKELNPKLLLDDYVKFIRFAQKKIEQNGIGIIAMITNNGFLDNATFRQMRKSLIESFSAIHIVNLHGNANKREKAPDGSTDENVFDIRQGVSISIFLKDKRKKSCEVYYSDLFGIREDSIHSKGKYTWLSDHSVETTEWTQHTPSPPFYSFSPQDKGLQDEYQSYTRLTDIFPIHSSGMNSLHDAFVINFDKERLVEVVRDSFNTLLTDEELRKKYDIKDSRDWTLASFRKALKLRSVKEVESRIVRCVYRPFDFRWVILDEQFVTYPRWETTSHMLEPGNLALAACRQVTTTLGCLASDLPMAQHKIADPYNRSYIFPLILRPNDKGQLFDAETNGDVRPNLSDELVAWSKAHNSKDINDIFAYVYALLHSSSYRSRYSDLLHMDFPRVPLTTNTKIFQTLAKLGNELTTLHLMHRTGKSIIRFQVRGSNVVDFVKYATPDLSAAEGRVFINREQYFEGVLPEVWNFHIGGYQVAEKWLKDRKGRTLSFDELAHYKNTLSALKETMEIMRKIDQAIEQHGGWPLH